MREQWIQYLPQTAKEIALSNFSLNKEDFVRSLKYSSTSPYSRLNFHPEIKTKFTEDKYTVCDYQPGDSPDYHKRIMASKRNMRMLMHHNWLDDNLQLKHIEYKINQAGFRDDHFNSDPGIACFGCSNTFGTGLNIDQTWPRQIQKIIGEKTYNLGTPALSLEVAAFYAINWFVEDLPNITAIAVFVPPPGRALRATKTASEKTVSFTRWRDMIDDGLVSPEHTLDFINSVISTSYFHEQMALKSLELLAKERNVPFVVHTVDETHATDWARDLQHRGPNSQKIVAEAIIKKLGKY